MERTYWIDWAKCIAITLVVFGHIPEARGNFLVGMTCTIQMPLFMFLSGYLTKVRPDMGQNLRKYVHTLVVPYLIYNAIFYPYWLVRLHADSPGAVTLGDATLKPLLGTLLVQMETAVSTPVNGVTWYLVALLLMRLLLDFSHRTSRPWVPLLAVALATVPLHWFNEFHHVTTQLTVTGFLRCFPFFLLGFWARQSGLPGPCRTRRDVALTVVLLALSTVCYSALRSTDAHTAVMLLFYAVNLTAIPGVLHLCMALDGLRPGWMVNVSVGTLMIMGLHWMFIGTINFALQKLLGLDTGITYPWGVAIALALAIELCIYPLLLFATTHAPVLLGKQKNRPQTTEPSK